MWQHSDRIDGGTKSRCAECIPDRAPGSRQPTMKSRTLSRKRRTKRRTADDLPVVDRACHRRVSLLMGEENDRRVQQAATVLRAYQQLTNSDDCDLLSDLLGDLLHWCDRHDRDIFHELDTALWHHGEEVKDE